MDEDIITASVHALVVAVNKLPQIEEKEDGQDERLTAMLNFIQNNYQEITLESMALHFHLSDTRMWSISTVHLKRRLI